MSPHEALHLCMTTEGDVDIVSLVPHNKADEVIQSDFAKLIKVNAQRVFTGVFNRYRDDSLFNDKRVRLAMNLAIDRNKLIRQAFHGYAHHVPALTPPWSIDYPQHLQHRRQNKNHAKQLLKEAGWPTEKELRLAVIEQQQPIAIVIATDIENSLNIKVKIKTIPTAEIFRWTRIIVEKRLEPDWDIFLVNLFALFSEDTPAFFHRELFGEDGAYRASPEIVEFDALFSQMIAEADSQKRVKLSKSIDEYVYDEALALFLCCPQDLYAVNRHVDFVPYRSTFELAETSVSEQHWSRLLN